MIEAKDKIMLMGKWDASKNIGSSVWLRASCDCGLEDHDLNIWIEWDEDFELIELRFMNNLINIDPYPDTLGPGYFNKIKGYYNKIRNIIERIKRAYRLLIYGEVKAEGDFIFGGEDQIKDFIDALNQSLNYVREGRRKNEG